MIITINNKKSLPAKQVPPGYENYHIPGAAIRSFMGSFGVLFVQEVMIGNASLLYVMVHTKARVSVEMLTDRIISCLLISLQGNWCFYAGQLGRQQINETHCNFLYTPGFQGSCVFEEKNDYALLVVEYTTTSLYEKWQSYPSLEMIAEQLLKEGPFLLFAQSPLAGASIMELAVSVVQSSYFPSPRNFHIQQVDNLLSAVCGQAANQYKQPQRFSAEEIEAIHAAKIFIDKNLRRHYTYSEIAQQVALNRQKLRIGFKALFGKGLYEYLLYERLTLAKMQLEQSRKPVKQIAQYAGYHNTSNFCTAFRKMFGATPNQFRKTVKQ